MSAVYKTGELDPDSLVGFATITEYVVMDVLGDATKEQFCASYDLISESLGTINVKYSVLHHDCRRTSRNRMYELIYWNFAKPEKSKIPDYYVCLGFDKYQTEIIRAWIIPGDSDVVVKRGVLIRTISEDRFIKYAVDPAIYNKVFQEMDIKSKPEFRNTTKPKVSKYKYEEKEFDLLYPCEEVPLNNNKETSFEVKFMKENDRIKLIKNSIYELSKTNKIITLNQIIKASGVEDPIEEIEHLVKRGIIIKLSPSEFRWV